MGMGIGAAMTGLRVIIEGMNMGFLLLAYNQISNNAGMLHYTSGGQYKVGFRNKIAAKSQADAALGNCQCQDCKL
jgi:pyruvate/2-oxoglutarate/acetoin dehydrogenase E1 component